MRSEPGGPRRSGRPGGQAAPGQVSGWFVPPPGEPVKSDEDLRRERESKVAELQRCGLLRSKWIRRAMLRVHREDFIPGGHRDYAYDEVPLPLPSEQATMSCPRSYPIFYQLLGLRRGHRFLEVGVGSGYGTALAREIVGAEGLVVSIELDRVTLAFARGNLERAGYTDIVLVHGDGGLGCPTHAPYDRICVTAACPDVPPPLLEQLASGGRLIAPVLDDARQRLTLVNKTAEGVRRQSICDVQYVPLRGRYGVGSWSPELEKVEAPAARARLSLPNGKLPVDLLAHLLAELPPPPPEVRLGPRIGEDACAIEVSGGALVAATDPITLTSQEIGRLSVIINANDVAVTGVRPRWFLAVVLVPSGASEAAIRALFATMTHSLASVGAHLVGGHTEVTHAVTQPIVVGQMLGLAETSRFVPTGGVRPGDVILQVGSVPIEGAGVLAHEAADHLGGLDPGLLAAARHALGEPGISVVEPALLAAELGATALHDPTEGGLAAGLHELAHASGVRLRIDRQAVRWFDPGIQVCRVLGADPWATLASGSLLAAFPPDRAASARQALRTQRHQAATIGTAEPGSGVHDTEGQPIPWPERDEVARLLSRVPRLGLGI